MCAYFSFSSSSPLFYAYIYEEHYLYYRICYHHQHQPIIVCTYVPTLYVEYKAIYAMRRLYILIFCGLRIWKLHCANCDDAKKPIAFPIYKLNI